MEKWEAVFFTSDDEKLEFENMFAKKICDSDNELYMSWLPLKLGDIGGDKELVCNLMITASRYYIRKPHHACNINSKCVFAAKMTTNR